MNRCATCGAVNPEGSRFCSKCGARLDASSDSIRCPMCGAANPPDNLYCDKCGARLVPMTAAAGPEAAEPAPSPVGGFDLSAAPREEEPEDVAEQPGAEGEQDWLAQLRASALPEAEELEEVAESVEADEGPDWLGDLGPIDLEARIGPTTGAPAAEAVTGSEPTVSEEVPDWLRGVMSPQPAPPDVAGGVEEVVPEGPAPEPAGVPDWLQELAPAAGGVEEAVPEGPALEPAEVPDWLQGLAPAGAEEAAPEEPAPELAEVPDWLQELAPAGAEEAAPEEPVPELAEVPDWLQELAPAGAEEAAPEVPDWLQELAPAAGGVEEAVPEGPAPEPAEVPDWLQEALLPEAAEAEGARTGQPPPEEAEPAGPFALLEEPAAGAEPDEMEEWAAALEAELASLSGPPVPSEGELPPPLAEAEGLARAEIPDWLEALRPAVETAGARLEDEPLEAEGVLEGLRGVLPVSPAIDMPLVHEAVRPVESGGASVARAQLLQSLLTRPPEVARPEVRRRGVRMGERLLRLLVAVVLVVAVVGALLAPYWLPDVPTLAQLPATPPASVDSAYAVIENVHAGQMVLVAFDYGPVEADELDLVAEPVLRHMMEQGAHLSVVSTRADGLVVAARVLDALSPGTEYDMTYQPGQSTGISGLLQARPDLVIVLTAQPGPLRWWVEQSWARDDASAVVACTSASLEPVVSPYLDVRADRQVAGAVSGLTAAAHYERLMAIEGGRATGRLNALAAGQVAVIGLMVVGAVGYALGGSRGRGK